MPLTDDKKITTPEYWETIYNGERKDQKTDASNFKRPANAFDRFKWLAEQVEGYRVLDIASGHATTMKRLRAMHPGWKIICTDQTEAAKKASKWEPEQEYLIMSAYDCHRKFGDKYFSTITVSQALEYFDEPDRFMKEARKTADYFVCTVPEGEMDKWTQLRVYTEASLKEWLSMYGEIVHFDKVPGLMLAKIKFNG